MELREQLQRTLSTHYTIERELAGGGMSRVFAATECALGRHVVVKVLPPELAQGANVERFRREIALAAQLVHPHIVPLLSAGDVDGLPYYTMPLLEGESLRARLTAEGTLAISVAVTLATEIASALDYAHRRGIVHRDIKPENVLLHDGHALVTDFGIARAIEAASALTLTQAGVALGTPAYMSPEQAVAERDIDGRADTYSLGCVVFEMITGAPPYVGLTANALFAKHLTEPVPSARGLRGDVTEALDRVIAMSLAKDPTDRFATAAEFASRLEQGIGAGSRGVSSPGTTAQYAVASGDVGRTIAVLPFVNLSSEPDAEFFSDGISEEILNALVRLGGLRVIARTSAFAFRNQKVDVRSIGQRLGAGLVLEGSVRKAGNRLRISAQLIDCATGVHLWSERFDREMMDVFEIQDEITSRIRTALTETLIGLGEKRGKPIRGIDPETYEIFLRGRYFLNRPPEGLAKGLRLLEEASRRAPGYSPALIELARANNMLANFGAIDNHVARPEARRLATQALAADPRDGRAYGELHMIAFHYDYDWEAARSNLEYAFSLSPDDAWINGLSSFFYSAVGEHQTAMRRTRHAVSCDPLNPLVLFLDVWPYYFARQWEQVVTRSESLSDLDPNYSEAYRLRAHALARLQRWHEAIMAANRSVELSGRHPYQLSTLAHVFAAAGRSSEARGILEEIERRRASEPVSDIPIASVQLAVGERDAFFATMNRYYDARGHWLSMLRAEPLFDAARSDPRFDSLLRRVGVPQWPSG